MSVLNAETTEQFHQFHPEEYLIRATMYNNNENLSLSLDDQTLLTIMNNKRHRSAAKSFKCPPQPKFCIKESLNDGREVFINVLSYSRIANQLSEFDPVSHVDSSRKLLLAAIKLTPFSQ